jgi:hypothetical protein
MRHHPEVLAGLPVPLHPRILAPCGLHPDAALTRAGGTHGAGAGRERILQVALKYSFQLERDLRLRAKKQRMLISSLRPRRSFDSTPVS